MGSRRPAGGVQPPRTNRLLMIELDQDDRAVDAVVEHRVVGRAAGPGESRAIEMRVDLVTDRLGAVCVGLALLEPRRR